MQANLTFSDSILEQKCTDQPFLILEGSSPAAVAVYHVFVDGNVITFPKGTSSLEAMDYLFMTHYVLRAEYERLKTRFGCLSKVFFMILMM